MEKHTRIREQMRESGITLTATAERMGITKGTLSEMINRDPHISSIARIADALGVATKDLIK